MEAVVHDAAFDMHLARTELTAALDEIGDDDWCRVVPYGRRTLKELLAHVASSDQVWALTARGLLKGDGQQVDALTPEEAAAARERAIGRGSAASVGELRDEMERRRALLVSLYELLEPGHLGMPLPAANGATVSVRERIWFGYHDRLHTADIRRALRMSWHPQNLKVLPELAPAAAALNPAPALYIVFSVDPAWWERPAAGHPEWTYRETLAHLATGDWVLQGHLRHVTETGAVGEWPDIAAGNASRLEERRYTTPAALVEEYLSMRHETLRLIFELKPEHLGLKLDLWWRPEPREHTLLDYLTSFHEHDRGHREQLRPAMKHNTSPR
jgi:hypothetical protein